MKFQYKHSEMKPGEVTSEKTYLVPPNCVEALGLSLLRDLKARGIIDDDVVMLFLDFDVSVRAMSRLPDGEKPK